MADQLDFVTLGAKPVSKAGEAPGLDFATLGAKPVATKATGGDMAGAAVEAGGRSLLQGGGILAGAGSGAAIGAPLGPVGAAIGGIAGGYLGYQAGDLAGESLGLRTAQQMPQELRPAGAFGEAVGGAVPFAITPAAMGVAGLKFAEQKVGDIGYSFKQTALGTVLNRIIETAIKRPIATAGLETSAAVSAGIGAAVSEQVAPGDAGIRSVGETVGGIVNPTYWMTKTVGTAMGVVKGVVTRMSPAAQQTEAAKSLAELVRATGEDPEMLARALRASGLADPNSGLTAAQRTGSMSLAAMEAHLATVNRQFGAEAANSAREGLDSIRVLIGGLTRTGDPAALGAAAELRGLYYRTMMQQAVDGAQKEAADKAGRISRGVTTEHRERISQVAQKALDDSMVQARAIERDLWNAVDGEQVVQTTNLQQTYNDIVADTLPELRGKKLPSVVRDFLNRVSRPTEGDFTYDPATMSVGPMEGAPVGTNAAEMRKLRSELMDMARAAARDPDQAGMARIYSDLAEATLDDLDAAFRTSNNTAYDEARTFTREFHDVFTRSFVGKSNATGKYGDRIAPELLLTKALATGRTAGALQLQELEEATRFLSQRGYSNDESYRVMMSAQDQIVRIAASSVIDDTGRASPERIGKFIANNPELMRRFPEVKADLQAAAKSTERLRQIENRAKGVQDILVRQGEFGRLMGGTSRGPDAQAEVALKAANRVLVAPDQEAQLARLIKVAQGGGAGRGGRTPTQVDDAMGGLRKALLNAALNNSIDRNGVVNIAHFRDYMTRPTTGGKKPLIQLMQDQKLITAQDAAHINSLFQQADNIMRSQTPSTAVSVKESVSNRAMTMLSRIVGSKVAGAGQAMTGGGSGASLIVHGAAARFAEEVMTKMPIQSVNKVLVEAMTDQTGEKMALLLTKIDDTPESAQAMRRIHGWLVQSALIGSQEASEKKAYEKPPEPVPMFSRGEVR